MVTRIRRIAKPSSFDRIFDPDMNKDGAADADGQRNNADEKLYENEPGNMVEALQSFEEEEYEELEYVKIKDCCGTPAYMAPEVVKTGDVQRHLSKFKKKKERERELAKVGEYGYGKEADIWSAGILLYSLVYGVLPYRGVTVKEIKTKIRKS